MVVNGNIAHLVPVVIGEDDGATVQIVSGLTAGDKVIQDPPDSLIEGEKVTVESPASQARPGRQVQPMRLVTELQIHPSRPLSAVA